MNLVKPPEHYPRPDIAKVFADELMGLMPLSDAPNGLFLAGDRRTGKTDFLKFDLLPELQARGVMALYVDLRVSGAPTEAMRQLLQQAIESHAGLVAKIAKRIGLEKIAVPGTLTIDLKSMGKADGMSVYQVLNGLHQSTDKRIALIIDEAQHALTHEDGDTLMWALKSARDQMKAAEGSGLMLVMSGSHTDKLTLLLNSRRAPFWGSQVRAMPRLGDDFASHFASRLRELKPELSTVRTSVVVEAFEHFGRRPQFFKTAAFDATQQATDPQDFERRLIEAGKGRKEADRERFTAVYLGLELLERAVLERLLEQGANFRAFDAPALAHYAKRIGKAKVAVGAVQRALDTLREHEEELVWRSVRGEYSVYDQAMNAWFENLRAQRIWPPM